MARNSTKYYERMRKMDELAERASKTDCATLAKELGITYNALWIKSRRYNFEFGIVGMQPWEDWEVEWLHRPISSTRLQKVLVTRTAEAIQRRRALLGIKIGRNPKGKVSDYVENYWDTNTKA